MTRQPRLAVLAAPAFVVACACSCKRSSSAPAADHDAMVTSASSPPAASSSASSSAGAPRPGMAWIPAGTLRAGTDPNRTPRVADEELAGVPIEMHGFYIDLLPYPNEPGAIPTSNVSRDEAEQLCASKGKRLCTELEWERACKGPTGATYGYGDAYRAAACETGSTVEESARRPSGERHQCKSGFGVSDLHGGVWEWTSSTWGRGSKDASLGVLRGGNSVAGELVGRCANGLARASSKKSPTMGLRCCAGPKNDAEVKLELKGSVGVGAAGEKVIAAWSQALDDVLAPGGGAGTDRASCRAWTWFPVANEELVVVMGCAKSGSRACGLVVGATRTAGQEVLAKAEVGRELPELARAGDARHLRIRSLDARGAFWRDVTYVYGRVELGDPKRP